MQQSAFAKHLEIARRAGAAAAAEIMAVYATDDFGVQIKAADQSPVGVADYRSNRALCTILHDATPEYGILSEETDESFLTPSLRRALSEWRTREYAWVIDPLDGTRDFIKRTGTFGVHAGLTCDGMPIFGLNIIPTEDTIYFGGIGEGSYKEREGRLERLRVSDAADMGGARVVCSRAVDPVMDGIALHFDRPPVQLGGMGYKINLVAQGSADCYAQPNQKSSLWDACSSEPIIGEAGGSITDRHGRRIDYRALDTRLRGGAIITNGRLHDEFLSLVNRHWR